MPVVVIVTVVFGQVLGGIPRSPTVEVKAPARVLVRRSCSAEGQEEEVQAPEEEGVEETDGRETVRVPEARGVVPVAVEGEVDAFAPGGALGPVLLVLVVGRPGDEVAVAARVGGAVSGPPAAPAAAPAAAEKQQQTGAAPRGAPVWRVAEGVDARQRPGPRLRAPDATEAPAEASPPLRPVPEHRRSGAPRLAAGGSPAAQGRPGPEKGRDRRPRGLGPAPAHVADGAREPAPSVSGPAATVAAASAIVDVVRPRDVGWALDPRGLVPVEEAPEERLAEARRRERSPGAIPAPAPPALDVDRLRRPPCAEGPLGLPARAGLVLVGGAASPVVRAPRGPRPPRAPAPSPRAAVPRPAGGRVLAVHAPERRGVVVARGPDGPRRQGARGREGPLTPGPEVGRPVPAEGERWGRRPPERGVVRPEALEGQPTG